MKRKKGISDFGGVLEWCKSWQWGEIWIPVGVSHLRAEPAGSIEMARCLGDLNPPVEMGSLSVLRSKLQAIFDLAWAACKESSVWRPGASGFCS